MFDFTDKNTIYIECLIFLFQLRNYCLSIIFLDVSNQLYPYPEGWLIFNIFSLQGKGLKNVENLNMLTL